MMDSARPREFEPRITQIFRLRRWGGGVYGKFSIRVLRQPDVNEGFDEELDEIVGEDGRGETDAGDAGDESLGGRDFEHVTIVLAHAFQKSVLAVFS